MFRLMLVIGKKIRQERSMNSAEQLRALGKPAASFSLSRVSNLLLPVVNV